MPTTTTSTTAPLADRLLDELLPEQLGWRRLVARYPLPSLLLAGVGGYLLARHRGEALLAAVGATASESVTRTLEGFLDDLAD